IPAGIKNYMTPEDYRRILAFRLLRPWNDRRARRLLCKRCRHVGFPVRHHDLLEGPLRAGNGPVRAAPLGTPRWFAPGEPLDQTRRLLDALLSAEDHGTRQLTDGNDAVPDDHYGHNDDVRTLALSIDEPVDWTRFGVWLTLLLNRHGEALLRVKGILNVADTVAPVAVHAVQHLVHTPRHLDGWP